MRIYKILLARKSNGHYDANAMFWAMIKVFNTASAAVCILGAWQVPDNLSAASQTLGHSPPTLHVLLFTIPCFTPICANVGLRLLYPSYMSIMKPIFPYQRRENLYTQKLKQHRAFQPCFKNNKDKNTIFQPPYSLSLRGYMFCLLR